jgi:hypothetical protein
MGRIPAVVLTAVIALSIVIPIILRSAKTGFVVASLLAIGILWAVVLRQGMPGGLRVTLLIFFYFITVVFSLLGGMGSAVFGWLDRPRNDAAVTLGSGSAGSIAIVYHPGGSGFTKKTITKLGDTMAAKGYKVTIFSAGSRLTFDQARYKAVILGSPVYTGNIRPPVKDFISSHSPLSIPVFIILTGTIPEEKEKTLDTVAADIARAGGSLRAGAKILSKSAEREIDAEIASFGETVDMSLKGR